MFALTFPRLRRGALFPLTLPPLRGGATYALTLPPLRGGPLPLPLGGEGLLGRLAGGVLTGQSLAYPPEAPCHV